MRTILCSAMMALATTTAGAAEQNPYSANAILPGCIGGIDQSRRVDLAQAFNNGVCIGAVMGLGFLAKRDNGEVRPMAFNKAGGLRAARENWHCLDIPDDTNVAQWVRVVVRYIEARPQRMREPFLPLALEALFDAWPCK